MKVEILKSGGMILCICIIFASIATLIALNYSRAEEIERISVEDAFDEMKSGSALVVCSYDDKACRKMLFKGALLRSEFESMVPSLSRDRKILFYCN